MPAAEVPGDQGTAFHSHPCGHVCCLLESWVFETSLLLKNPVAFQFALSSHSFLGRPSPAPFGVHLLLSSPAWSSPGRPAMASCSAHRLRLPRASAHTFRAGCHSEAGASLFPGPSSSKRRSLALPLLACCTPTDARGGHRPVSTPAPHPSTFFGSSSCG